RLLPQRSGGIRLVADAEFSTVHDRLRDFDELAVLPVRPQHPGADNLPHGGELLRRDLPHPPGFKTHPDGNPAGSCSCCGRAGTHAVLRASTVAGETGGVQQAAGVSLLSYRPRSSTERRCCPLGVPVPTQSGYRDNADGEGSDQRLYMTSLSSSISFMVVSPAPVMMYQLKGSR